jgi:hypothetical protein
MVANGATALSCLGVELIPSLSFPVERTLAVSSRPAPPEVVMLFARFESELVSA